MDRGQVEQFALFAHFRVPSDVVLSWGQQVPKGKVDYPITVFMVLSTNDELPNV